MTSSQTLNQQQGNQRSLQEWTQSVLSVTGVAEFSELVASMALENTSVGFPTGPVNDSALYYIDLASMLPPALCDVPEVPDCGADGVRRVVKVLDMCAAPGGKSLAILHLNSSKKFSLISSDGGSTNRLTRLRANVKHWSKRGDGVCGPECVVLPATSLDLHAPYNVILLDAPCTSDRHLMTEGFAGWSLKLVRTKAEAQRKLLSRAVELLAPGGQLVYSTCALSEMENDDVVEFGMTKFGLENDSTARIESLLNYKGTLKHEVRSMAKSCRATKHGYLVLPHLTKGSNGPIYVSSLRKPK